MSDQAIHNIPAFLVGNPVLPVVVIDEPASASALASALVAGGVTCAEITLRTPGALACIEAMGGVAGFTVGAGTVLHAGQAKDAVTAGAQFLISPGYDDGVLDVAAENGIPAVPGIATATEAQRAHNAGVRVVKFFPANAAGGPEFLSAIAGPFPDLRVVPTGGITMQTASTWLSLPTVVAVGGSWLTPPRLIAQADFAGIVDIVRETRTGLRRGDLD